MDSLDDVDVDDTCSHGVGFYPQSTRPLRLPPQTALRSHCAGGWIRVLVGPRAPRRSGGVLQGGGEGEAQEAHFLWCSIQPGPPDGWGRFRCGDGGFG